MFLENYRFKYPWRKYQANVLAELHTHIQDDKLNIVAAPGSGKTILGLEVARRINKNVLILSPTLTIKNQWIERFLTTFVQDAPVPDFISNDIYNLKKFNVATYQGLHFAYRRQKIVEETIILEEEESTNAAVKGANINYDLIGELIKHEIEVIILDEAHHLRNSWWKSLTAVIGALQGIKLISLTATPPYDVEKNEWDKYVELCGTVDCEISVPELVATGDLCPHQDYVIFNKLTIEEERVLSDVHIKFQNFSNKLKTNRDLIKIITTKSEIKYCKQYEEKILETPQYYSSLLIFLHSVGVEIDKDIVSLLGGSSSIPALDMQWLEIMLQGVLFDDDELYVNHRAIIDAIRAELSLVGGVEKKKVMLQNNNELKKLMACSVGKMESIIDIARREYNCLRDDLSMVILADYIRIDALKQDNYNKIGVVPIFNNIIKARICPNIAILTGSLKVIPDSVVPFVKEKLPECDFQNIGIAGYVSIVIREKYKNRLVGTITEAIIKKKINIVVGTVALLGEGWDCQAVNSLILSSFVGSFMLSNQMRGRAIRTDKNDPNKVANIWHLVSITRHDYQKALEFTKYELSDFHTLKRRFQGFVGIAYTENVILNGLERLNIVNENQLPREYQQVNKNMYMMAKNRQETKRRWHDILALFGGENIKLVNTLQSAEKDKRFFHSFAFIDIHKLFTSLLIMLANSLLYISMPYSITSLIIAGVFMLPFLYYLLKFIGHYNPIKNIKKLGNTVLASLKKTGDIQTSPGLVSCSVEKIKVLTELSVKLDDLYITKLNGATIYENNLYIKCMQEIYKRVDNPRYLIIVGNRYRLSYFNVPSLFSVNKTNAELFFKYWKKYVGNGTLVYTRNAEGRKVLLNARKGSFDYNDKFFERKRAIKHGDWK